MNIAELYSSRKLTKAKDIYAASYGITICMKKVMEGNILALLSERTQLSGRTDIMASLGIRRGVGWAGKARPSDIAKTC